MRDTEFFQRIRRIKAPWRDGAVLIPAFFYDVMAIEAGFLASADRVKSSLPSPRMHPFRLSPGRCLVAIAALEYRDSDIGPYNEVMIGIPFTLDKPSPLFTGSLRRLPEAPLIYVHRLPVTTEIALHAGVDFFAAPKFLAGITFDDSGDWVRCRLVESGATSILTLAVRKGEGKRSERSRSGMITTGEGYLLRWDFIESEQQKSVTRDAKDVQLELGSHPLAEELRQMRLEKVLYAKYKPQFQAILAPVVESFRG